MTDSVSCKSSVISSRLRKVGFFLTPSQTLVITRLQPKRSIGFKSLDKNQTKITRGWEIQNIILKNTTFPPVCSFFFCAMTFSFSLLDLTSNQVHSEVTGS